MEPDLTEILRRTRLKPEDAELFQILGRKYQERGRTEEAKAAYERALAIASRDEWTHLYLGNWQWSQGNHGAAVEWFSRAAELLPERSVAFWCLANVYEAQGLLELADSHYRKAVEVDPSDQQALSKLREWERRQRAGAHDTATSESVDGSPSKTPDRHLEESKPVPVY